MFRHRATRPERIDTGDYTPKEYATFLREIRFINQRLGDRAALEKTLLVEIARLDLKEFSVLDVGAGTGELLGVIAEFARSNGRNARLVGLDLNELSINEVAAESLKFKEIVPVQGNALTLPFDDNTFDYAICSLFTHHLADEQIPVALGEMSRVARRGIVVIDLERSAAAWFLYQLFCLAYRISPLVRRDGSLSIRKGFTCREMIEIGNGANLGNILVQRHAPYRVVMSTFSVDKLLSDCRP
ncbi:MAG: methyltransferase domain-containing protein [Acidobacteria bacterium]|nr:methyltransferase domain-containing protein [Acidobacteriota bacterium]